MTAFSGGGGNNRAEHQKCSRTCVWREEQKKRCPQTHPSWSAAAPSAGSGWPGLGSHRPCALSCGWTAGPQTRRPRRHPPDRWRGWCARSRRCRDGRRRANSQHHVFHYMLELGSAAVGSLFKYWPRVRCKVVLHSLLVHREQAGVLGRPGEGAAALLVLSCREKNNKENFNLHSHREWERERLRSETDLSGRAPECDRWTACDRSSLPSAGGFPSCAAATFASANNNFNPRLWKADQQHLFCVRLCVCTWCRLPLLGSGRFWRPGQTLPPGRWKKKKQKNTSVMLYFPAVGGSVEQWVLTSCWVTCSTRVAKLMSSFSRLSYMYLTSFGMVSVSVSDSNS